MIPPNARIFSLTRLRSCRLEDGAGQRLADDHRNVAGAVRAADDGHRALAREDRFGGARHGLKARRAGTAHAERLDILGQPRAEDDLARDVGSVEAGNDLPINDQLDLGRVELRARQELPDDELPKLQRGHVAVDR